MKKNIILLFVLLLSSITLFAQAPSTFKYQAVVRDTQNNIVPTHNIGIRASILEDSPTGICVYSESFNETTNAVGLINLNIGGGTPVSGAFAAIDWSTGFYWIKLEVDMTGGTTYTPLGTPSQLVSVPYAKFADRAGKAAFPAGMIIAFGGDTLHIPDGWLLCNGAEISRTTYADLFNAVGIAWGEGDMVSTYNLPDLRGTFLRGAGTNGAQTDATGNAFAGGAVGNYQEDKIQGHRHDWGVKSTNAHQNIYDYAGGAGTTTAMTTGSSSNIYGVLNPLSDGTNGTPRTGYETKPASYSVNYIIKY